MKIAFIGDIIGRPGRLMVKEHLERLRHEHGIDWVIANYENASHGFGLTLKNANELFSYGIDVMTGGNHSWDKKEIVPLFETLELLRPHNYPDEVPGSGMRVYDVGGERLAVLNLMGHYGMPHTDNAFRLAQATVEELRNEGIQHIFMDFHAEASSEKRAMFLMLQGRISAMIGTHTHISSDDFQIVNGSAYLSDIGLTGCRDNVIGMDTKVPLQRFLTGMPGHFDIPKKCKRILQMAVMTLEAGRCVEAFKIKCFDDGRELITSAWHEA